MKMTYKGQIVNKNLTISLEEISANLHGNREFMQEYLLKATGLVEICLNPPGKVIARSRRNGRMKENVFECEKINELPLFERLGIAYMNGSKPESYQI